MNWPFDEVAIEWSGSEWNWLLNKVPMDKVALFPQGTCILRYRGCAFGLLFRKQFQNIGFISTK